jgi:hypothetical protein
MVLPTIYFVASAVVALAGPSILGGGATVGERQVVRANVRDLALATGILLATAVAVGRWNRNSVWRVLAWACGTVPVIVRLAV